MVGRVLVVGGGLTAASLASLLRGAGVQVAVWDKAGRPGGRFTSHRRRGAAGQVDLGGQFVTASGGYRQLHAPHYAALVAAGVLRPLQRRSSLQLGEEREEIGVRAAQAGGPGVSLKTRPVSLDHLYFEQPEDTRDPVNLVMTDNYVAPHGTEAIVRHFWETAGVEVQAWRPLEELRPAGGEWVARGGGGEETFDCVVTTMPVPQLLGTPPRPEGRIEGVEELLAKNPAVASRLRSVEYNSVFCLGLFFDRPVDWGRYTKYWPSDDMIRYMAVDTARRGHPAAAASLCVQSHVRWAEQHLHRTKQEMAAPLLEAVRRLLPDMPEPAEVLVHKWRYSQTSRPYPGHPGAVLLHAAPPLLAAGDSFTHSNFDGCLHSARAAAAKLLEIIGSK